MILTPNLSLQHRESASFRIKLVYPEAQGRIWVSNVINNTDEELSEVRFTEDEIKEKFILDTLPILNTHML